MHMPKRERRRWLRLRKIAARLRSVAWIRWFGRQDPGYPEKSGKLAKRHPVGCSDGRHCNACHPAKAPRIPTIQEQRLTETLLETE